MCDLIFLGIFFLSWRSENGFQVKLLTSRSVLRSVSGILDLEGYAAQMSNFKALSIANNTAFTSIILRWRQKSRTRAGKMHGFSQTLWDIVHAFPCIKANVNTGLSVHAGVFGEHLKVRRRLAGKLFSLKCLRDVEGRGGDHV